MAKFRAGDGLRERAPDSLGATDGLRLAVWGLPTSARAALREVRRLRRLLPGARLRIAPEAAEKLLADWLGEAPAAGAGEFWFRECDLFLLLSSPADLAERCREEAAMPEPLRRGVLAAGLPVVGFDTPPVREWFGPAAVLVPGEEGLAGLARGVARLGADPEERARLRRRGKAFWKQVRRAQRLPAPEEARPSPGTAPEEAEGRPAGAGTRSVEMGARGELPVVWSPPCRSGEPQVRAGSYRKLSVVLALYGQRPLTEGCLATLRADLEADPQRRPFEIVCVDNASPDDTRLWLELQEDVRPVFLSRNHGCAGGWNAGLGHATGDLLCVLNNDTRILSGGMRRLAAAAWRSGVAAAAGGFLNEQLETVEGSPVGAQPDFPNGCALAFRRDVWESVGAFDEGMQYGYCEDADWGLRARLHGYRWAIVPGVLEHLGSRTARSIPDLEEARLRNQERLRLRWAGKGVGERIEVRHRGGLTEVQRLLPVLRALRREKPLAWLHLRCDPSVAAILAGRVAVDSVSAESLEGCTRCWDLQEIQEASAKAGPRWHETLACAAALGIPLRAELYQSVFPRGGDSRVLRRRDPDIRCRRRASFLIVLTSAMSGGL